MTNVSSVRASRKSIVGVFEGGTRGKKERRERARTSEKDRGGLILNPGDWRVLDETRRVLATPDGTDALSDVKLKHAALTRRFDDTPYNLTLSSLSPRVHNQFPITTSRDSPVTIPRPRQALIAIADLFVPHAAQYDGHITFFWKHDRKPWHVLRDIGGAPTMPLHR